MAFVIHYDSSGNPQFACSGTLVSHNVVLTAGHCAVDETTGVPLDPSGYRVVTGAVDWTDTVNRQVSTVSDIAIDPSFDLATVDNDAALLALSAPVASPSIPLWGSGQLFAGTGGSIAGWGHTYAGETAVQTLLRWAPTVVQSATYCSAEAPLGYVYDSTSELCAVNAPTFDTATCNGDSGGPLLVHNSSGSLVEAGITSVGPPDCDTITADYFTAVLPIAAWIENEITAVAPRPPAAAPPAPPPPPPASPALASQPAPLPSMTVSDGRSFVRQTLAGVFGRTFRRRHAYRTSCAPKSRFTCSVSFWSGPNDYWGTVSVYYVRVSNGVPYWSDTYTIHWVNDRCYFYSGHRARCAIHTRHGSW